MKPLRPGERPTAVTVGAIFAGLMALANLVALGFGYNAAEDTLSPGSKLTGSILATGILGLMAWGMWKARYWAVLGMQTLLALTLIVASLGLITATTLWAAVLLVLIITASGTLFWFLVKAMARIQMPERPGAREQRSIGSPAMPEKEYDCIVIGSGPGGYVAAIRAAQLGLKTAVVEKGNTGGRCLNEACIPAKSILRVAEVMSEVEHAGSFGISTGDVSFDYAGATKHRDKVVKTLTGGVGMLFEKNKIELIEGFGSVTDDANVKIGGQFDGTEIKTDRVILATRLRGQAPARPPVRQAHPRHRRHVAVERAARAAVRDRRRGLGGGDRLRVRAPGHRGGAARGARPDPAAGGRGDLQGVRAGDQEAERAHRDRSEGRGRRGLRLRRVRRPSTASRRTSTTW